MLWYYWIIWQLGRVTLTHALVFKTLEAAVYRGHFWCLA